MILIGVAMNVLFICGFLGSGKTTVLNKLLKSARCLTDTIAVVENEIGDISIDSESINGKVQVTAISGGCICCELFGDLLDAITDMKNQYSPDWLIIETTGLAMLSSIKNNYLKYGPKDIHFYSATVVDCVRFEYLWEAVDELLGNQISPADVIILSKTDLCTPSDFVQKMIAELAPCAKTLESGVLAHENCWQELRSLLPESEAR